MFKADQNFEKYLLALEFKDVSEKYHPNSIKKRYEKGRGNTKISVIFEAEWLSVIEGHNYIIERVMSLSPKDFDSIIKREPLPKATQAL